MEVCTPLSTILFLIYYMIVYQASQYITHGNVLTKQAAKIAACLMILLVLVLVLEHAIDSTLVLALLDGLALIELALASSQGDNQLGKASLVDEEAQRHNGNTWLLGVAGNAANFLAVQQQLAIAMSRVVIVGSITVLGDIHVLDPNLTIDHHAIGIGQAALALTNGLNLGTSEDNARGKGLDDLVVERRLAVLDIDGVITLIIVSCHSCDIWYD